MSRYAEEIGAKVVLLRKAEVSDILERIKASKRLSS